jgi:hypothetical protein
MFSEFGRRKSVVSEIYSTLILVQKREKVGYTYIAVYVPYIEGGDEISGG